MTIVAGEGILGEVSDGFATADGKEMLDDTCESLVEEGVDTCSGGRGERIIPVNGRTHRFLFMDDVLNIVIFSRKCEERF